MKRNFHIYDYTKLMKILERSWVKKGMPSYLEETFCASSTCVYNSLRDSLSVKLGDLLHKLVIFQEHRPCWTDIQIRSDLFYTDIVRERTLCVLVVAPANSYRVRRLSRKNYCSTQVPRNWLSSMGCCVLSWAGTAQGSHFKLSNVTSLEVA